MGRMIEARPLSHIGVRVDSRVELRPALHPWMETGPLERESVHRHRAQRADENTEFASPFSADELAAFDGSGRGSVTVMG